MSNISEEIDLKKNVGVLGMFMVEKAQQEIKEIHRKTLFQKAEIRKEYLEKKTEGSSMIKINSIETYTQLFNNYLASALLKSKEKLIRLKNELLDDLRFNIHERIKEKINNNYSRYIEFLLEHINNLRNDIDNKGDIIIFLNSKDYNYFSKDLNKIEKIFKNSVIIKQDPEDFIGGFKVDLTQVLISYDYSIETIINKNYVDIEIEFSKLILDLNYKEIDDNLVKFIQLKKKKIEEYIRNYD
ncbi:MAG: V-type ATP synthase subunit E [Promethearchaeota archaeon]